MRVHSIEEIPPHPESFDAYLPVAEKEWGIAPLGAVESPIFDVRAVGPRQRGVGSSRLGPLTSVVSEVHTSGPDAIDFHVGGLGARGTILRAAPEAENFLEPGAIVIAGGDVLAEMGRARLRKVRVTFVEDPGQDPWESDVWLPVLRLHRPAHPGCVTTCSTTESRSAAYSASFAFAGLGGGGETRFTVDFTRTYKASATCKEAVVRARGTIRFGSTLINGQPIAYGARVKIHDIDPDDRRYRDLPRSMDGCGLTEKAAPAKGRRIVDLMDATGGADDSESDRLAIGRSTSGFMSLGVTFGRAPVTITAAYSRSCAQEVAVETLFMPGARYLGYLPRPECPTEKCWTVLARRK